MFTAILLARTNSTIWSTTQTNATNLIEQAAYQAVQQELRTELDSWFVRYADPERDGSREAVMGRGQLDIVGPAAQGRQRFANDVVYHATHLHEQAV